MHIIKQIFKEFEIQNVRYCHFKSNQNLSKSFNGDTDFDVLVDPECKAKSDIILTELNCKKFEPVGIGIYPGVENWYVFDNGSGKLFHLHLHFQIATGKQFVKDYILPWDDIVLETSIKNEEYNTFISNPEVEILLLLTRIVVKSKVRDLLKSYLGLYKTHSSLQEEYVYLQKKISIAYVEKLSNRMFTNEATRVLLSIVNKPIINSKDYRLLVKTIRNELKNDKRMNSLKAFIFSVAYKIIKKYNRAKKKLNLFTIDRKVTITGGKLICFVGVDGSGKSTLTHDINKWLIKGKVENKKVYMGTGDGNKPLLANVIGLLKSSYKKNNRSNNKNNNYLAIKEIHLFKNPIIFMKNFLKALEVYSVVKSNRKKIIRMHKYRLNGGVSIVDRYHQLQLPDMNDGLKIKKFSRLLNNKYITYLEQKEYKLMKIVELLYPDIIFRLNISTEVSMQRKPEENTDYNYLKYKTESLKELSFENSLIYEIDAEKSYDEVLIEIKRAIWNNF